MPQDEASTGQLLARLSEQLSTLVRDEAALAVVEVKTKPRPRAWASACWSGRAVRLPRPVRAHRVRHHRARPGAARLALGPRAVGGALILLAGALGAFALVKLRKGVPPVPEETVANVKDDAAIIRRAVTR
ncbi:phage holin family protein [Kutzneria kofuensis]|uniref:phage holin family protein n=1 Tax=Kutzneria kofuensis TaxID=103725 RepID=UPI0031F0B1FA